MKKKIALSKQPDKPHIPKVNVPAEEYMSFGFKYFEQYDFFGLKDKKNSYFIALLEKLKSFSNFTLTQFQSDSHIRHTNHIHAVNWNAKNIPIKKNDLKIPDAEDTEVICFKINSGGGRCAGFFDENRVFQIVLCDPQHNLQPSKDFGYKVNQTETEKTCFEYAHAHLQEIKNFQCDNQNCLTYTIQQKYEFEAYSYIYVINPDKALELEQLKNDGMINCIHDVLDYGLSYLKDNKT